jgi:hypothetical protein
MNQSQYATPLLIKNGKAAPLHRIVFDDDFRDENWLQQLLFDHPHLIPFDEIEPAFKGSVAVAREVESGSGPIDIIYCNADGLLTLVETKLWRNPESRRTVVSQLINYAAELSKMTGELLAKALAEAEGIKGDLLEQQVSRSADPFDLRRFHDALSLNLKRGRFLLLIIGDGIREDVDSMAEFLQGQPQMGFTLGLVEMGLFRVTPGEDGLIIVQPRIVARTKEVVRAIVEVRGDRVIVETPEPKKETTQGRYKITEEEFYAQLAKEVTTEVVAFAKWAVEHANEHHLTVQWMQGGPVFKYVDADRDVFFTLFQFDRYGNLCELSRFSNRCKEMKLPKAIWTDYYDAIVSMVPGASRKHFRSKAGNEWDDVTYTENAQPLALLSKKKDEWIAAVDLAVQRIRDALAKHS